MTLFKCLWPLALAALPLTACTQFPELDRTQTPELEAAEYPALVPIAPILAKVEAPQRDPVQTEAAMNARLAGLRTRADRLRGQTALTDAERQKLVQGLR